MSSRDASRRRGTGSTRTIYFKPIGTFDGTQAKILEATVDYTGRFFGLPVKMLEPASLSELPADAFRNHPVSGEVQALTTYLIAQLLKPALPQDAIALIGLTTVDLYPAPSWNFVFGEAYPDEGLGVWSIARFGDPSSPRGFSRCLRRTIDTAVHEIGHLCAIDHCVAWECQMNGRNSLEESDSSPLDLCPACLQKLAWFTGADPAARLEKLAQFARQQGYSADAALLEKEARLVRGP